MQLTVVEPPPFSIRNALSDRKPFVAKLTHVLFAKVFCFLAVVTLLLVSPASWAAASPTPQVRQIYVKNDGTYLQWKAVYDVNFNWDFNSDPNLDQNRGPTLEIFGLQGLPAGQGLQTRIWLFPQDDPTPTETTPNTVVFSVDLQSQIQYGGQAIVSGNETIGYISLSTLANAGFSLPSDISKLSFGNYNLYCGNGQICAETIYYSASAFLPLSVLDNNWRLILDIENSPLSDARCYATYANDTHILYLPFVEYEYQNGDATYYEAYIENITQLDGTQKQVLMQLNELTDISPLESCIPSLLFPGDKLFVPLRYDSDFYLILDILPSSDNRIWFEISKIVNKEDMMP